MKIVRKNIAELRPSPKNARTHSEQQIGQLAKIISDVGFLVPLVIKEDDEIVAGHGRLEAAKQAGLDELPCVLASGLIEEQIRKSGSPTTGSR